MCLACAVLPTLVVAGEEYKAQSTPAPVPLWYASLSFPFLLLSSPLFSFLLVLVLTVLGV